MTSARVAHYAGWGFWVAAAITVAVQATGNNGGAVEQAGAAIATLLLICWAVAFYLATRGGRRGDRQESLPPT